MDTSVIIAVISAVTALFAAYLTYRSSAKATAVSDKKVDQEAYDRAINFYQKQLDDAAKQLDRVSTQTEKLSLQLEAVSAQLAQEKDTSFALRNQIRILQSQLDLLNGTVSELRSRLGSNGKNGTPPPPPTPATP